MRVMFAGGVTGGHVAPGVALAEHLLRRAPGSEVVFASVANEIEERMVGRAGFPLVKVAERKRGSAAQVLGVPGAWLRARRLVASFRPDVVVGLGGGASLGPALAAVTGRRPLFLIEQNVVPGRANRWLAPRAERICCQWETAARRMGPRAVFTGAPVRREIAEARNLDRARARKMFGLAPDAPTLLVAGGSQGAHALNVAMMQAAARLAGRVQVVHLAGEADRPTLFQAYRAAGVTAHVSSFFETMHLAYAAADLALSRAGATSIAELAAAGVPALLVPYPAATDDHQRANAREAAAQGWAAVVEESELNADRAARLVTELLADRAALKEKARRAVASARPDAADAILAAMRAPNANPAPAVAAGAD